MSVEGTPNNQIEQMILELFKKIDKHHEEHQNSIIELKQSMESNFFSLSEKLNRFSMITNGDGMMNYIKLEDFEIKNGSAIEDGNSIKCKGYTFLLSKNCYKIDARLKYEICAEIKTVNNHSLCFYNYVGFMSQTEPNGPFIEARDILHVSGTFTKIIRMEDDNTLLYVTNSHLWDKNGVGSVNHEYIAFGAKEDNSDLPNKNLVQVKILSVDYKTNTIRLAQPLEIPADFRESQELFIRKHTSGNNHNYCYVRKNTNCTDFFEYKGCVQHYHDGSVNDMRKWRPGAKYARIMAYLSYPNPGDPDPSTSEIIIRNIRLKRK